MKYYTPPYKGAYLGPYDLSSGRLTIFLFTTTHLNYFEWNHPSPRANNARPRILDVSISLDWGTLNSTITAGEIEDKAKKSNLRIN